MNKNNKDFIIFHSIEEEQEFKERYMNLRKEILDRELFTEEEYDKEENNNEF